MRYWRNAECSLFMATTTLALYRLRQVAMRVRCRECSGVATDSARFGREHGIGPGRTRTYYGEPVKLRRRVRPAGWGATDNQSAQEDHTAGHRTWQPLPVLEKESN